MVRANAIRSLTFKVDCTALQDVPSGHLFLQLIRGQYSQN